MEALHAGSSRSLQEAENRSIKGPKPLKGFRIAFEMWKNQYIVKKGKYSQKKGNSPSFRG